MRKAVSRDGTAIAYDRSGDGPAVILVGGALGDRSAAAPLVSLMAPHLTTFAYDRRGRGDSGDTAPYAVEREIEDIDALIGAAGGSAFLYGHSSGAALALEAAASGLSIGKLALYEPPFIVDDSRPPVPADYAAHLAELVSSGRRGDAVAYFMTAVVGVPAETVAQMQRAPMWAGMESMAHTLLYDARIVGDNMAGSPLSRTRWSSVTQPTLVMAGGASPAWIRHTAQQVADVLPDATYRTLEGQTHGADPEVLAPVLVAFLTS